VKGVPYSESCDENDIKKCFKHRLSVVKKFIGQDLAGLEVLDIGHPNKFGRALGVKNNTNIDLNACYPLGGIYCFDVVTCFEVIEHVMNPLALMENIRWVMKPGGLCYLSTPIRSRLWHEKVHFTEYYPRDMKIMFEYAGFEIVKYKKFCLWDWDFMFWGFRPFFRVLTQRTQLWALRKI
jgi:SAM-dependent methyltransferase